MAKWRSKVKATIIKTEAHIDTCPNASIQLRKLFNLTIPRAERQEGILQKIKTVSTIQTTSNNWLNEVSRIFGRDKTIIDMELPPIPKIKDGIHYAVLSNYLHG